MASTYLSKDWRKQVLNGLLRGVTTFGFFAVIAGIYNTYTDPLSSLEVRRWVSLIYGAAYLVIVLITFVQRIPYGVKTFTLLAILYGIGIIGLKADGLSGDGRLFILTFIIISAIFLSRKQALISLGVGIATMATYGWLFSTGKLYISPEHLANTNDPSAWTTGNIVLLMLAMAAILPISYIIQDLEESLAESRALLKEREARQKILERAIEEHTQNLERKTRHLQAASQVAREIVSAREDIKTLLQNTTELITEHFGFYHAGIFLLDARKEYAILQAASSEGGKRMLARGHRLQVGLQGVVGAAAADKRSYIALDVGEDAVHFANPDLPLTHSEMALPLMVNEEVIGVLDIQSTEKEAFTQEDIGILQTLADQIAFAIQNTRLLEESRSAVEELRTISISDTLAAWRKRLQRRPHKYRYSPLGIFPVFSKANTEPKDLEGFSTLEIPITLRGRKIGLITLSRPVERPWNEREKDLAKNIGEQIGLAIENARLVEDTHARAQREELVSEISSRIRSTLDIDTVLQTAVQEIQKAFDLQTAEIQLGVPETELDTSSQGGTQ